MVGIFFSPGTYGPSDKKRQMKFYQSFGGKRTLIPAVDVSYFYNYAIVYS